jgi:hypothetical protein
MTWWTAVGHAQQLPVGNSTESATLARPSRMSGSVRPQIAVIVVMIALTACGSSTAVPAQHHPSSLPVQHHLSPVARAPSGPPAHVAVIERAHLSWRAYMEDLPAACFTGSSTGGYAKKHDPSAYYTRITTSQGRCANIVPLTSLYADERNATLPRFIWITPNLCHDMRRLLGIDGRSLSLEPGPGTAALAREGRTAVPHLG